MKARATLHEGDGGVGGWRQKEREKKTLNKAQPMKNFEEAKGHPNDPGPQLPPSWG